MRGRLLELVKEVEERSGPEIVTLESFMNGISESIDDLDHCVDIEEVEAQSVLVGWLAHESAVDAVPDSDVGADLGGDKLGKTAHAGHGLRVYQSVNEVLCEVGLDWLQELDLVLVDQGPNDSEVKVQVSHNLST